MMINIGEIIESVPCMTQHEKGKKADQLFGEDSSLQGIVVVNGEKPIALLPRSHFYQKIGSLYGYNLYMGREIELVAKTDPLIVDFNEPITIVSKLSMNRKEEDLYDYVIVTKDGHYAGIVSIQKLLMKLVEVQVEFASYLNPLTKLPGNHMIESQLKSVLTEKQYSILYFDLDHFKAYNDTYGFKKGDDLLQTFSDLLKKHLSNVYFLGHIGGDDFMAIIKNYDVEPVCRMIVADFQNMIKQYYEDEHLTQQYVIAENRSGKKTKAPLLSLSIAVLTNRHQHYSHIDELSLNIAVIKKQCKLIQGSCCFVDREMMGKVEGVIN